MIPGNGALLVLPNGSSAGLPILSCNSWRGLAIPFESRLVLEDQLSSEIHYFQVSWIYTLNDLSDQIGRIDIGL